MGRLRPSIEWIAPTAVYPGEDELRALAEGGFRVLDGEEEAKIFAAAEAEKEHRKALVIGLE